MNKKIIKSAVVFIALALSLTLMGAVIAYANDSPRAGKVMEDAVNEETATEDTAKYESVADNYVKYDETKAPEIGESGSITVAYEHNGRKLSGAEISIYKAADAKLAELPIYTLVPELSAYSEVKLGRERIFDGMTAVKSGEYAKEWQGLLKEKAVLTEVTDSDGRAVFENLPFGAYVVAQTGKSGISADYTMFEPYLVFVPFVSGGEAYNGCADAYEFQANIETRPKTDVELIPLPETPKTGDSAEIYVLLAAAAAAGGFAVFCSRRKHSANM